MRLACDLTAIPPSCVVGRNDLSGEPEWFLEVWPRKDTNDEVVTLLCDSLDDLDALWQAIRDAVERRRRVEVLVEAR